MNTLQSLSYKIKSRLNKGIINKVLIALGFEKHIKVSKAFWENYLVVQQKTDQEISGYSHVPEVDEAIALIHKQLQACREEHCKPGSAINVLDIGCGPGLYLKDFPENVAKYGIDLNKDMLKLARKNNPDAILTEGEFLKENFTAKFNMVYCIGVLQYFTPVELQKLFQKASSLLHPQGILFISYPHAVTKQELAYPDINYISYSPKHLNSVASEYFSILSNNHLLEDRIIDDYDKSPAAPPKGFDRTCRNSSTFIGQKKS